MSRGLFNFFLKLFACQEFLDEPPPPNFPKRRMPEYAAMLRLSEAIIIFKNYPDLIIEKNILISLNLLYIN